MNVFTEGTFETSAAAHRNISFAGRLRLACDFELRRSVVQFLCLAALFWVDSLPHFGTSPSTSATWHTLKRNAACMAHSLNPTGSGVFPDGSCGIVLAMSAVGFCSAYVFTYVASDILVWIEDANFGAIISGIGLPISVALYAALKPFHLSFVPATTWLQVAAGAVGSVPLVAGMVVFTQAGDSQKRDESTPLLVNSLPE